VLELEGITRDIGQLDFIGRIELELLLELEGITGDIGQLDFIG
jgi:hypothetical protein